MGEQGCTQVGRQGLMGLLVVVVVEEEEEEQEDLKQKEEQMLLYYNQFKIKLLLKLFISYLDLATCPSSRNNPEITWNYIQIYCA